MARPVVVVEQHGHCYDPVVSVVVAEFLPVVAAVVVGREREWLELVPRRMA